MKFLGFQKVFEGGNFRPLATLGMTGGGAGVRGGREGGDRKKGGKGNGLG